MAGSDPGPPHENSAAMATSQTRKAKTYTTVRRNTTGPPMPRIGMVSKVRPINGLTPKNLSSLAGIARPFSVGGPAGEALQVRSRGLALVQVMLLRRPGRRW